MKRFFAWALALYFLTIFATKIVASSIGGGGGGGTLAQTLALGNTTGANSIILSGATSLQGAVGGTISFPSGGISGLALATGQSVSFQGGLGDATAGDGGAASFTAGNARQGNGGALTLSAGSGATTGASSFAGGDVSVAAGSAVGGGSGGNVSIQAGQSVTGAAGAVSILGGLGGATSGNGGNASIGGGSCSVGNENGGGCTVSGGSGSGSGSGGTLNILGGNGGATGSGGAVNITGGSASAAGAGANVTVQGGQGLGTDQNGGTLSLVGGRSSGLGASQITASTYIRSASSNGNPNSSAVVLTIQGVQKDTSGTATVLTFNPSYSDSGATSSTLARAFLIQPTINYTAASKTGSYEALAVSALETSLPTGTNYLLIARAGTLGTSTRFAAGNGGSIFITDNGNFPSGIGMGPAILITADNSSASVNRMYAAGRAMQTLQGRSNNTTASPTDVASGDIMATWLAQGYSSGGGGFNTAAQLRFTVDGSVSGTTVPGRIEFCTNSSAGVPKWCIKDSSPLQGVSGASMGFCSSSTDPTGTSDVAVSRQGAAGVLGVLNPSSLTSSASLRVYNTTDAASGAPTNAEWVEFLWSANVCGLNVAKGGSGTLRALTVSATNWSVDSFGTITAGNNIGLATTKGITWGSRSTMLSDGDGSWKVTNFAGTSTTIALTSAAGVITFKNVSTAGLGVAVVYAANRATAQTGANASVATFTPAADGSFEISANVNITTHSSENFTVTVAYTDEASNARTTTLNFSNTGGTLGTACNAAGVFQGVPICIRAKASNAITIATTGTFTGATYNVEGFIVQKS